MNKISAVVFMALLCFLPRFTLGSEIAAPENVLLPTELIVKIRQFLGRQPHDEVDSMIKELEECYQANQNLKGCLVVTKELKAQKDALADAAKTSKEVKPSP